MTQKAVTDALANASAQKYEYVWVSRAITVPKNAELTIRAMGAGGGGGSGAVAKGGAGGTVALKTLTVPAGAVLAVTIPAGGAGGNSGGTLQVRLNSSTILSIPGGGSNGVAALNPTGADWFVKSTPPTGTGGGSAMLLEGFSATGTATSEGGAGVLGNGGSGNGGGLLIDDGGSGGWALADMTILKFAENLPNPDQGVAFTGGVFSYGADNGGAGGFGGGGGGGAGGGGAGGFGGGGGGGSGGGSGGGAGGQGWVTLEWRYV